MIQFLPQWVPEITPAGVGVWSLLAVVSTALIKVWPIIQLQVMNAKEKLRGEHRSDLSECHQQIAALQLQVSGLSDQIHGLELKLLGTIAAYRILDTEIELTDPTSRALAQARQVMSTAFTLSPSTDLPLFGEGI